MSEMNDGEETSEEPKGVIPWVTGIEAFSRYGLTAKQLREHVKAKRLHSKRINGREMFSCEDLEKLSNEDDSDGADLSAGDLVRASRDLLSQAQTHHERMFEKLMGGLTQLLKSGEAQIDKQNEHILALEKQALEMREAAEKVFNLEHQRKMDELKEERTRSMQAKALEMLQKTMAPWIAQKLGASMPAGVNPTGETTDPRMAQLGQAVINMVLGMTDEQFAMLQSVIPAPEYEVLKMIRDSAKGAS